MRVRILTTALLSFVTCLLHAGEVRVSDAMFGTPPGFRAKPAIQRGGDGFLVAWVDERTFGAEVFAARLNDAGVSLDRSGFSLGRTLEQARPQIIWNGEAWLVFWSSHVGDLMMGRVTTDGTRGEPRVIAPRAWGDPRGRSVATNGRIIVVAYAGTWDDPRFTGTYITVLSMNGDRISERQINSQKATTGMVTERDGEFAVAWNRYDSGNAELFAIRLDGSANILDASPRLLGKGGAELEFTRHGNGYLVLAQSWGADRWKFTSNAVSADLASSTTPSNVQISESWRRTFVQDGASAVLIAADGSKFRAFRFDAAGHETSNDEILPSALPLGDVAMTRTASGFTASWIVIESTFAPRLVAAKLDPSFVPTTPQRAVSETARPQTPVAIVFGPAEMLVAWLESPGLHLAQFGYDGRRLGDDIVLDDFAGNGLRPVSLLFDGERYVVAYASKRITQQITDAVIHFVAPRGGLLPDSVHLPVGYESTRISLAKGRSSTIVLWRRDTGVMAAALTGTALTAQPRALASGIIADQIAAVWNGESFVAVWYEGHQTIEWPAYDKVAGAFVDEDLQIIGSRRIFTQTNGGSFPSLDAATRGSTAFAAFENAGNINILRIEKDGSSAKAPLSVAGTLPHLASDGNDVDLAWFDGNALRVAPLTSTGSLKSEGVTLLNLYNPYVFRAIARRGGLSVVAYSRLVPEAGAMPRAFLSLVDETPNPGRRRSAR
jgi:hypothetical protein